MALDASHAGLIDPSRNAAKSAAKGGTPNALFVVGSAQELPGPFAGCANSVSVLFPWGSLLQAVLRPDPEFLDRLHATCAEGARIEVVTAVHPEADASELARLGLTGCTLTDALAGWRCAGFEARVEALAPDHEYQTTWWRKIRQREGRVAWRLTAKVQGTTRN